jgi:hypothetical protein
MRVVQEILNPQCKITVFHWNNRYIIKLERGFLEQTFKIDQFEIAQEKDLERILDEAFIKQAIDRFSAMSDSLHSALQRVN